MKQFYLAAWCSFLCVSACAQDPPVDSLLNLLNKAVQDTAKVNLLNKITEIYVREYDVEHAAVYQSKAAKLAEEINYKQGIAQAMEMDAQIDDAKSEFDSALQKFNKALLLFQELDDKPKIGLAYQGLANSYYSKGMIDKALTNYFLSLKIREQLGDSSGIANSMMGLSIVYNDMNRNDLALVYAMKSLGIKERRKETRTVSWLLNNIGLTYLALRDTANALKYYHRSLEIKKATGDEYGMATTLKNLGGIYLSKGEHLRALENYRLSYSLRHRVNPDDLHNLSRSLNDIGSVYLEMRNFDSASFYTRKAIELGEKINSFDALELPYLHLSRILSVAGKHEEAMAYLQKYVAVKDSSLNRQTNQLMTEMAAKYDNEKKEQQLALQDAEIRQQRQFRNYLLLFVVLVVLFLLAVIQGYRNKKKANEQLAEKNNMIEMQKQLVEERNKDITDSIHYARRIQLAILPTEEGMKELLPAAFVLFKPKDIVSGDLYWVEKTGNKTVVAVVDCTGHGVPGAFMTFMAYSLLNEAVLEHGISTPADILNEMRRNLYRLLRQKSDAHRLKDGMDIALCVIDRERMTMEFAGAFNPLWMIREGKLTEIKGDKQPIGIFLDKEPKDFSNHVIKLEKNDLFYIFTDGYADQFGGEKGKKFKYKTLQKLLLDHAHLSPEEQRTVLDNTIEAWRSWSDEEGRPNVVEQVDDICILGMRVV